MHCYNIMVICIGITISTTCIIIVIGYMSYINRGIIICIYTEGLLKTLICKIYSFYSSPSIITHHDP